MRMATRSSTRSRARTRTTTARRRSRRAAWTPTWTVEDGEWLGAFANLDLDPRWADPEIYTGGKRGNLYSIRAHRDGGVDTAIIARFPGEEIHTFVAGDLAPDRPGNELLAFTHTGNVYDLRPKAESGNTFDAPRIAVLSGRVRDAKLLPTAAGKTPRIIGVCRSGEVLDMRVDPNTFRQAMCRPAAPVLR